MNTPDVHGAMAGGPSKCRYLRLAAAGLALLARSTLAAEFTCVGEEKGINTLTGKERVIPVTLHVNIKGKKATLQELSDASFAVREDKNTYKLKASLGGRKLRPSGEYTLQIDKQTGEFTGEVWLLSRANISTQKGKCAPATVGD